MTIVETVLVFALIPLAIYGVITLLTVRPKATDLRVVPVHDHRRVRRQLLHGRPPPLGDELELAVAVELVAEEVAEADHLRPHAPRHLRQSALVDLEEPELRARGREQRRGDA